MRPGRGGCELAGAALASRPGKWNKTEPRLEQRSLHCLSGKDVGSSSGGSRSNALRSSRWCADPAAGERTNFQFRGEAHGNLHLRDRLRVFAAHVSCQLVADNTIQSSLCTETRGTSQQGTPFLSQPRREGCCPSLCGRGRPVAQGGRIRGPRSFKKMTELRIEILF